MLLKEVGPAPLPPRIDTAGVLFTTAGGMLLGPRATGAGRENLGAACWTGTGAGGLAGKCEGRPVLSYAAL